MLSSQCFSFCKNFRIEAAEIPGARLQCMEIGKNSFTHWVVVPNHRIIAWLEDLNGTILFSECYKPSQWHHKRLKLKAQYWKHNEFFPHKFQMETLLARHIRREVGCYLGACHSGWGKNIHRIQLKVTGNYSVMPGLPVPGCNICAILDHNIQWLGGSDSESLQKVDDAREPSLGCPTIILNDSLTHFNLEELGDINGRVNGSTILKLDQIK
ncbi:hypothetical protein F4604DRAFT_1674388 [Suillus subluteus]|nr:hypothetical protein F4604DRAFT_1674388 [Suillus subluteus]